MFRDMSPSFGPTHFASGNAPPSPPISSHHDPLDDIYGSAPTSPALTPHDSRYPGDDRSHEILSDLPSRQRALDTDAYREGLSNSKGQYVQEGFDEGYSLGANIGQRVGYIIGFLQGVATALKGSKHADQVIELLSAARKELAIQEVLGPKWINEEGIWKWDVEEAGDNVTFRIVAEQHPVIKSWSTRVAETAARWNVDLNTFEQSEHQGSEESP
jgi:hypothetical protein